MELRDHYGPQFARLSAASGPAWLTKLREGAFARFSDVGLPTKRDEDWKYTSTREIAQTAYQLANGAEPRPSDLARVTLGDGAAVELVFVNGRYASGLSTIRPLPEGVRVTSLVEALVEAPELVEANLGRLAPPEKNGFLAWNLAFAADGAFVHLAPGAKVERPVHLVFLTAPGVTPEVAHVRNLVVAEAGSSATVLVTWVGPDGAPHLANAVTEIALGEDASIEHVQLQLEGDATTHVERVAVAQATGSQFTSRAFAFGGALARTDVAITQDGERATATLDGLYLARGRQHLDVHTAVDHRAPHGASHELYKGILDDQATGVFNGKIVVRPDAQHVDSSQTNRNLLLSEDASINTKPELEIFADDVKCAHGATIGRLDEQALFFLRSRGLDPETARGLLLHGFASELVERIPDERLRERIDAELRGRLGHVTGVGLPDVSPELVGAASVEAESAEVAS